MRILFIHHGAVIGGASVSLINTILGLKEADSSLDIKVLCARFRIKAHIKENAEVEVGDIYNPGLILGRVLIGYASLSNMETLRRSFWEFITLPKSIFIQVKQLKAEKPNIIHLNSSILFSTAIAAKISRVPLVWHVREVLQGARFNPRKILAGWFIRTFADKVITISAVEAEQIGKDNNNKVTVVYNFIDFNHFDYNNYNSTVEKKKLGIPESEKLILSLGGVSFRKGTVQLIDAMKYVQDGVKLVLAGPYPPHIDLSKNHFKRFKVNLVLFLEDVFMKIGLKSFFIWFYNERVFKELSLADKDKICFLGYVNDVVPLIAASDILVFAGTTPHFPRPVYEAWAMKKPVIAFNMNGIKQNVSDNVNGILVKGLTGKALGEAINSLVNNEIKIKQMGEAGYLQSYDKFRRKKNILKILEIYRTESLSASDVVQ